MRKEKEELLWDEYFIWSIFVTVPPWGKNREYIPWNTSSVISPVGHSVLNPLYILFISARLNLKKMKNSWLRKLHEWLHENSIYDII